MKIRALAVDDDASFLNYLVHVCSQRCIEVLPIQMGSFVFDVIREKRPDLLLLDRFLPDSDGFEICEDVKLRYPELPVILFSNRSEIQDMVDGIYLGADDFLAKPFPPAYLIAKIHAVLRRYQTEVSTSDEIKYSCFRIDTGKRQVFLSGAPLTLTKTEYKILYELVKKRGRVLSKDQIVTKILGYGPERQEAQNSVSFHIGSLRGKLKEHRQLIKTIRGVGFRLICDA